MQLTQMQNLKVYELEQKTQIRQQWSRSNLGRIVRVGHVPRSSFPCFLEILRKRKEKSRKRKGFSLSFFRTSKIPGKEGKKTQQKHAPQIYYAADPSLRGEMSVISRKMVSAHRAHTKGVVQQRNLLRRVLRRVVETAFKKVLRRVLRRCFAVGFNGKKGFLRRVLRRGSTKGLSRRRLEGRSTPFREYNPLGVRPSRSCAAIANHSA